MATTKYLLQSNGRSANIYVRFSVDKKVLLDKNIPKRKTGFIIDAANWNVAKSQPILRNEELQNLKIKLDGLRVFVEAAFNSTVRAGGMVSGDWLQRKLDLYNNKAPEQSLDVLTNYLDKYLLAAPYRQNQRGETGLSKNRIKSLQLFKNTVLRFEKEQLKSRSIM